MVRRVVLLASLAGLIAACPAAATDFSGWVPAGEHPVARHQPVAALLGDGRVLLTGGQESAGDGPVPITASAEFYDPATNAWTPAPPMTNARLWSATASLRDGRVLVTGGVTGLATSPLYTAEVFDARTNAWTPTEQLNAAHEHGHAVTLADGRVLVVGTSGDTRDGRPGPDAALGAELYDPRTNAWTLTRPMTAARVSPAVALLRDGRVLAAGGSAAAARATAEIYDPKTDTWTALAPMHAGRLHASAATLPDGRVLVAGGQRTFAPLVYWETLTSAEIFDPATGAWTPTGPMTRPRGVDAALATLVDGRPAFLGGSWYPVRPDGYPTGANGKVEASVDVLDPALGTWSQAVPPMLKWRTDHVAITLRDGSLLVTGDSREAERLMPVPEPPAAPPATPGVETPPPGPAQPKPGRLALVAVPGRLKPSRAGVITLKLRCTGGACRDRVALKRGTTTLARRDVNLAAGRTVAVRLKLPTATRRALRTRSLPVMIRLTEQRTTLWRTLARRSP